MKPNPNTPQANELLDRYNRLATKTFDAIGALVQQKFKFTNITLTFPDKVLPFGHELGQRISGFIVSEKRMFFVFETQGSSELDAIPVQEFRVEDQIKVLAKLEEGSYFKSPVTIKIPPFSPQ